MKDTPVGALFMIRPLKTVSRSGCEEQSIPLPPVDGDNVVILALRTRNSREIEMSQSFEIGAIRCVPHRVDLPSTQDG